mgnify:CR=1 FL=1
MALSEKPRRWWQYVIGITSFSYVLLYHPHLRSCRLLRVLRLTSMQPNISTQTGHPIMKATIRQRLGLVLC